MSTCSTKVIFRQWGLSVGTRPWTWVLGSFTVAIALSMGTLVMEVENRPEKMWVPETAPSLKHKEYVDENWPSDAGVEMYIATCPKGTSNCNMLEPTLLKEVFKSHINFYNVLVDGTKLVHETKDDFDMVTGNSATDLNGKYGGKKWVYDKNLYAGSDPGPVHSKCMLWNANMCDTTNIFWSLFDGDRVTGAHPKNPTYFDGNFETLQKVLDRINAYASAPPDKSRGQSIFMSFLGGIARNDTGHIVGASHLLAIWGMTNLWVHDKKNDRKDLVNLELEYQGLCGLGIDFDMDDESCLVVPKLENVAIYPMFQRWFRDAFKASVLEDGLNLIIANVLIMLYMFAQLGKRDSVHSMMGLATVTALIVACAMQAGSGIGFLLGQKQTELVRILWFLVLGLGVDDAFVLVNEFNLATKRNPGMPIPRRISATAVTAGHSILVTSVTDALAFLVGALTILPALRGFCIFGGVTIILCFIFQMTIFLPCIAINAARTEENRLDVCCCIKAKVKHEIDYPQGSLGLPGRPFVLEEMFSKYSDFILRPAVRVVVIVLFIATLVVGIIGVTRFETNFKPQWFIPDDSPTQDFFTENENVFGQAMLSTIYIPNSVDHYAQRANLAAIGAYIGSGKIFIEGQSISWAKTFEGYLLVSPQDVSTAAKYYTALHTWIQGPGNIFERMILWHDRMDPTMGIKDSKMITTLNDKYTRNGMERFDTLVSFRKEIDMLVPGAFPYAFPFLFWEEAGIIVNELVRNLVLAGGAVFVVIFTLIWDLKISLLVCLGIVCSITEVVGYAHFWGVTANGTSVIFILLCVGLAVDYSAHIAHMFRISNGTPAERSKDALIRIGPSVLNALVSTFLAVLLLGLTKSYVFRVFFKILCLTSVLAGAQGLVCLPVILSLLGGSRVFEDKGISPEYTDPPAVTDAAEKA